MQAWHWGNYGSSENTYCNILFIWSPKEQEVIYAVRNLESGETWWLDLGTKEATAWLDMFYFLVWVTITENILGLQKFIEHLMW